jgi:hypothetical protein
LGGFVETGNLREFWNVSEKNAPAPVKERATSYSVMRVVAAISG